jgi:hypothetical protein
VSELRPGDLCVIIASADDTDGDRAMGVYGKTVVLIEVCGCAYCNCRRDKNTYWRVSGLRAIHSVWHLSLRKIPPDQMHRDIPTITEIAL